MFIIAPIVACLRMGGNWAVALFCLVPIFAGIRIVRDELRFRKQRVWPWGNEGIAEEQKPKPIKKLLLICWILLLAAGAFAQGYFVHQVLYALMWMPILIWALIVIARRKSSQEERRTGVTHLDQ